MAQVRTDSASFASLVKSPGVCYTEYEGGKLVNSTSRAAALLVVTATAFVLAQTASAAELGLSVGVQDGTPTASAEVAAPVGEASVETSAALAPAAASVSAAAETDAVAARVDVAARPTAAAGLPGPGARARKDPGARTNGLARRATPPRDRSIVTAASAGRAAQQPGPPAPLTTPSAQTGAQLDVDLAPLPERSTSDRGASVEAAAAGISGSPVALVGLLLVVVSLLLRPLLGAFSAPRPSLHAFVLQRPG